MRSSTGPGAPRVCVLAVVAALAAGCGAGKHAGQTGAPVQKPPPGKVLYGGGVWAVTMRGGHAAAWHLVHGAWRAERSGPVEIDILGPHPGQKVAAIPQVAIEVKGNAPLVETGLWVDGTELYEKGGGLSSHEGTIYGAPAAALAPGTHTAVGYGRTAAHAFAVSWTFRV